MITGKKVVSSIQLFIWLICVTIVWWVVTINGFCKTSRSSAASTDLELPYNTTFIRVLCRRFLASVQLECVEPVLEAIKVILTLQFTREDLQIETITDLQNETITDLQKDLQTETIRYCSLILTHCSHSLS